VVWLGGTSRVASGTANSLPCSPFVTGCLREGKTPRSARTQTRCSWALPHKYTLTIIAHNMVNTYLTNYRLSRAQLYPSLTAGVIVCMTPTASHTMANATTVMINTSPAPFLGGLLTGGTSRGYPGPTSPARSPVPILLGVTLRPSVSAGRAGAERISVLPVCWGGGGVREEGPGCPGTAIP
jgi:hypothetical protein